MKLLYFDEKHFSQLSYKFKTVLKQKSPQVVGFFFFFLRLQIWTQNSILSLEWQKKQGFKKAVLLHSYSALAVIAN